MASLPTIAEAVRVLVVDGAPIAALHLVAPSTTGTPALVGYGTVSEGKCPEVLNASAQSEASLVAGLGRGTPIA